MTVYQLRSLIGHMDMKNPKATQDQTRLQLLSQELAAATAKYNYVSIICQAFEGVQLTDDFCSSLFKLLKLTFAQHVAFGLALAQSNESSTQQQGECNFRPFLRLLIHPKPGALPSRGEITYAALVIFFLVCRSSYTPDKAKRFQRGQCPGASASCCAKPDLSGAHERRLCE